MGRILYERRLVNLPLFQEEKASKSKEETGLPSKIPPAEVVKTTTTASVSNASDATQRPEHDPDLPDNRPTQAQGLSVATADGHPHDDQRNPANFVSDVGGEAKSALLQGKSTGVETTQKTAHSSPSPHAMVPPPSPLSPPSPPSGSIPAGGEMKAPKVQMTRSMARRYRPTKLSEIVGQDVLVRTLTQAIKDVRPAHAYLFTGTRGVGKTTAARVFAASLNCAEHAQPTVNPCGHCSICRAIMEGTSHDVHELDAASNNSVERMRELVETVVYQVSSRFKVYILDEVHVLSQQAFNALLKTIEEPPANVIFILATTELQKIPRTIVSRCQVFGFKPVDVRVMTTHLANVAMREGLGDRLNVGALRALALAADGSVREGLSLLEKTLTYAHDGPLGEKEISDVLGTGSRQQIVELFDAILEQSPRRAIELLRTIMRQGKTAELVFQELMTLLHAVTIRFACEEPDSKVDTADLTQDHLFNQDFALSADDARYQNWKKRHNVGSLSRTWQIFVRGYHDVHSHVDPWMGLEMLLLRAVYAAGLPLPIDLLTLRDQPDRLATLPTTFPSSGPSSGASSGSEFAPPQEKPSAGLVGSMGSEVGSVTAPATAPAVASMTISDDASSTNQAKTPTKTSSIREFVDTHRKTQQEPSAPSPSMQASEPATKTPAVSTRKPRATTKKKIIEKEESSASSASEALYKVFPKAQPVVIDKTQPDTASNPPHEPHEDEGNVLENHDETHEGDDRNDPSNT